MSFVRSREGGFKNGSCICNEARRKWLAQDDFAEISDRDRKKLLTELESRPDWLEVDYVKEA